mmetsp:Transcript_15997/g.26944  ORF Transcript_15997/g.26944 Transcript_15997/m.26944 type:complete len:507 (+) Transcript_15997:867-2387(+)
MLYLPFDAGITKQLQQLVTSLNRIADSGGAKSGEEGDGMDVPAPPQMMEAMPFRIEFSLILPGSPSSISLTPSDTETFPPLILTLYATRAQVLVPSCSKSSRADPAQFSMLAIADGGVDDSALCGQGFPLTSPAAIVHVHLPNLLSASTSAAAEGKGREEDGEVEGRAEELEGEVKVESFYPPIPLPQSAISIVSLTPPVGAPSLAEADADAFANSSSNYVVQCELQPLLHYLQIGQTLSSSLATTVSPVASVDLSSAEVQREILAKYRYMYMSVCMDGVTPVPQAKWAKLHLLGDNIAETAVITSVPPKTGFAVGNNITLQLDAYLPPPPLLAADIVAAVAAAGVDGEGSVAALEEQGGDGGVVGMNGVHVQEEGSGQQGLGGDQEQQQQQVPPFGVGNAASSRAAAMVVPQSLTVRIRGSSSDEFPDGACTTTIGSIISAEEALSASAAATTTVSFDIPEDTLQVEGMIPVQAGPKDKPLYFIDLSMDGGSTFDLAPEPLLFLK